MNKQPIRRIPKTSNYLSSQENLQKKIKMTKSAPTELIAKISNGQKDPSGNLIENVLATGNEYAIYEINHKDINYSLRVIIDGYNDESEQNLKERFNLVKQRYIEAKGLLYRSQNYGMMKNRIAHTLATCLSTKKVLTGNEFDELITKIETEIKSVICNKIYYLLPSIFFTFLAGIAFINFSYLRTYDSVTWPVIFVIFGSLLGGSLSIISQTKRYHFEEFPRSNYYFIAGIQRIFLSLVAGIIAYEVIRSKIIFPELDTKDYWKLMTIIIAAAFSERMVPNLLSKVEKRIEE